MFDSSRLLILKGWNSQVHGGFPRNSESAVLSLRILNMRIDHKNDKLSYIFNHASPEVFSPGVRASLRAVSVGGSWPLKSARTQPPLPAGPVLCVAGLESGPRAPHLFLQRARRCTPARASHTRYTCTLRVLYGCIYTLYARSTHVMRTRIRERTRTHISHIIQHTHIHRCV